MSVPIIENDKDRDEANREFRGSVLFLRLKEETSPPNSDAESTTVDDIMSDDAIEVIAVNRRRRA